MLQNIVRFIFWFQYEEGKSVFCLSKFYFQIRIAIKNSSPSNECHWPYQPWLDCTNSKPIVIYLNKLTIANGEHIPFWLLDWTGSIGCGNMCGLATICVISGPAPANWNATISKLEIEIKRLKKQVCSFSYRCQVRLLWRHWITSQNAHRIHAIKHVLLRRKGHLLLRKIRNRNQWLWLIEWHTIPKVHRHRCVQLHRRIVIHVTLSAHQQSIFFWKCLPFFGELLRQFLQKWYVPVCGRRTLRIAGRWFAPGSTLFTSTHRWQRVPFLSNAFIVPWVPATGVRTTRSASASFSFPLFVVSWLWPGSGTRTWSRPTTRFQIRFGFLNLLLSNVDVILDAIDFRHIVQELFIAWTVAALLDEIFIYQIVEKVIGQIRVHIFTWIRHLSLSFTNVLTFRTENNNENNNNNNKKANKTAAILKSMSNVQCPLNNVHSKLQLICFRERKKFRKNPRFQSTPILQKYRSVCYDHIDWTRWWLIVCTTKNVTIAFVRLLIGFFFTVQNACRIDCRSERVLLLYALN